MPDERLANSAAAPSNQPVEKPWERRVLEKVLLETVREQRLARRWGIFFKIAFLSYLTVVLLLAVKPWSDKPLGKDKAHTAVVDIAGMIAEGGKADADAIIEGLRAAVEDKATKGIILKMNTPGGTPVQAAYVYEEVRRIKREHAALPIYAVVSDLCTSGGYYIAAAADKIYVNPSSIIGSIGVIMNGFGFVEAMNKLGIERRVFTAGEHKALLDPFSPLSKLEQTHIQGVLDAIHKQFIEAVRQGRGDRLKDQPELYTGLVWTGAESLNLGLVDAYGDVRSVAEREIGAAELVNFTKKQNLLERITQRIGSTLADAFAASAKSAIRLE